MGFSLGGLVKLAAPIVGAAFGPVGMAAGGALSGLLGANDAQKKADKLNKQQLQIANQRYAETGPLRQLALQKLQNTQRPDLTNIYQNRQNPFASDAARPQGMPVMGGLAPQAAAPPPPSMGGGGSLAAMAQNALRARRQV